MSITVSRADFVREVVPDPDPDTSYLDQEEWEDRKREYQRGDFGFVGVRAAVNVPIHVGTTIIIQRMESPGLWGIEDDSGDDYFDDVFHDEAETLADMLAALGVTVTD